MVPDDLLAIARDTTRKAGVMTNSISTEVGVLPPCDLCRKMRHTHAIAAYDGATVYGPWAYMCTDCFDTYGIGLGEGRGQVLLLKPPYDLPSVSDEWEACKRCGKEYAYPHLCREHMLCGACHPHAKNVDEESMYEESMYADRKESDPVEMYWYHTD